MGGGQIRIYLPADMCEKRACFDKCFKEEISLVFSTTEINYLILSYRNLLSKQSSIYST
jgi:hypothetical protein